MPPLHPTGAKAKCMTASLTLSWFSLIFLRYFTRSSLMFVILTQSTLHWIDRQPGPQYRIFLGDITRRGEAIPGLARNSRCCGKVNHDTKPGRLHGTRIVNGTATRRGEFPWMVRTLPQTRAALEPNGRIPRGSIPK